MNDDRDQTGASDSSLDALLAQARWDDTRAAESRLRVAYLSRSQFSWKRVIVPVAAVAAMVAVVVTVVRFKPGESVIEPKREIVLVPPSAPREPTLYERLVAGAAPAQREAPRTTPREAPRVALPRILDGLVQGKSPVEVAADLRKLGSRAFVWRELRARVDAEPARAAQIVAVLGALATRDDLPQMLEYLNSPGTRGGACPAVVRLADHATLLKVVSGFDAEAQEPLIREVLAMRRDAVEIVLLLVRDGDWRDATLSALKRCRTIPVNAIATRLGSGDPATRNAAARILGAACHAGSLPLLADLIKRNQHRREALQAMLGCTEPTVRPYLDAIQRDRTLATQLTDVREEIQQKTLTEQL